MIKHFVIMAFICLCLAAVGESRADGLYKIIGGIDLPETEDDYVANARQVTRLRGGTICALYCRVPVGEYYSVIGLAVSDDQGQTWSANRLTTDAESEGHNQREPSLAVDASDTLHAVWIGTSVTYPNAFNIRYAKKPLGGTWSTPVFVTTDSASSAVPWNSHPAIAVGPASSSLVWVAWERYGGDPEPGIYYASKLCAASSWPSPSHLVSSDYSQYAPSIAIDDDGVTHIAWYGIDSGGGDYKIYYLKFGDIVRCPSAFPTLTNHAQIKPCLALMNDGRTPAIAFLGYDDDYPDLFHGMPQNIHVVYGDPSSWVHRRLTATNTRFQYPPSITSACDDATALTVSWGVQSNATGSTYQALYSYYNDNTGVWQQPALDLEFSPYLGNILTCMLWANWPEFNGRKSNRPHSGFPLIAVNKKDSDTFDLRYWFSGYWAWDDTDATPTPLNTPTPIPNTPTPVTKPSPTPAPTPIPNRVASGDYDGDGYADCAVFRPSSGLWAVYGLTRFYFGSASDIPVSGDYNGDGTTEAGIFRASTGLWAIRDLPRAYLGGATDVPVPADYDDDGTDDIATFRSSSGLWAVQDLTRAYFGGVGDTPLAFRVLPSARREFCVFSPSDGSWAVRNFTRCYLGRKGDVPVPEDYNGLTYRQDEVAIFRPDTGLWSILNYTVFYFGSPGDNPVPAQYGPGLSTYKDVAIFRPSSGLWSVRSFTSCYLGFASDKPVTK